MSAEGAGLEVTLGVGAALRTFPCGYHNISATVGAGSRQINFQYHSPRIFIIHI